MAKTSSTRKSMKNLFGSLTSYVLFMILLVCFGLGLAWQHVKALTLGYSIRELEQEKQEIEHQRRLLLLERASLTDYHEIERKATRRLGFQEPEPGQELLFTSTHGELELQLPREREKNHRVQTYGVTP